MTPLSTNNTLYVVKCIYVETGYLLPREEHSRLRPGGELVFEFPPTAIDELVELERRQPLLSPVPFKMIVPK
jgi:hypothetical protein